MDPLKAVEDLDKVVSEVPMNRVAHAHFVLCVAVLRQALTVPIVP